MTGLAIVWLISAALAVLSIVMMLGLVVRRLMRDAAMRRWQALKQRATKSVFAYLDGSLPKEAVLKAAGSGRPFAALVTVVTDMVDMVRGNDHDRLVALLRSDAMARFLVARSRDRDLSKRRRAAHSLALIDTPESRVALYQVLEGPSADERLEAALSLARMGALDLPTLFAHVRSEAELHSTTVQQILGLMAPDHRQALLALAHDADERPRVRAAALIGLAQLHDYGLLPDLIAGARDRSAEVRGAAINALRELGHPGAIPVIAERLADPVWFVRALAARCAGQMSASTLVEPLEALLEDSEWWVRYRAAEALRGLGADGQARLRHHARRDNLAGRVAQIALAEAGLEEQEPMPAAVAAGDRPMPPEGAPA